MKLLILEAISIVIVKNCRKEVKEYGMKKLGKKGGFNEGTLVAFACACNCNLCLCTSCSNCNTIPNATGIQVTGNVTYNDLYNKSFGPMTLLS